MILRKPYAFLIKFFKLIHIIMFVFFSYIVFVLRKIYMFFKTYVQTSNFTYFEDMATRYVPIIVFFFVIIILALAIGILLLMRKKDKPILFYKLLIGYSSGLLIAFIYFFIFFKSLDTTVYEPLRVVVNRDIILFIYIVNFFFVAFSFIRGFGFDIKKFSFEKDKKELNFEESDNEEYELNLKIEKDDVVNYLNKQKREFKYYLKENSLILSIVGGVILVGAIIFIYLNFFVYNKTYHEKDDVEINKVIYNVTESYLADYDKYGKKVSGNNDYLIVYLSITDNQATGYLDSQAFRVRVNDEYYYPQSTTCDLFNDVGDCYKNQLFKVNTSYNYILVYKISTEHEKIYFEILKSKGEEYKYSKVLLSPKSYERQEETYKIDSDITIDGNIHQINGYQLIDKTSYEYQECVNDKCDTYIKTVSPRTGDEVLILNITDLDKISLDFINAAFGIKYNDKMIYGNEIKYIDKHDNSVYLSVPGYLKNTNNFTLVITTRTKIFNVELGG